MADRAIEQRADSSEEIGAVVGIIQLVVEILIFNEFDLLACPL
jgi:hypothetical protein